MHNEEKPKMKPNVKLPPREEVERLVARVDWAASTLSRARLALLALAGKGEELKHSQYAAAARIAAGACAAAAEAAGAARMIVRELQEPLNRALGEPVAQIEEIDRTKFIRPLPVTFLIDNENDELGEQAVTAVWLDGGCYGEGPTRVAALSDLLHTMQSDYRALAVGAIVEELNADELTKRQQLVRVFGSPLAQ